MLNLFCICIIGFIPILGLHYVDIYSNNTSFANYHNVIPQNKNQPSHTWPHESGFVTVSQRKNTNPTITIKDRDAQASPIVIKNQSENSTNVILKGRTNNIANAPKITVRSRYDSTEAIALKVASNRFMPSQAMIDLISRFNMVDNHGVRITVVDIDPDHNIILGISGGTAEIIATAQAPDGLWVTGSFQENNQFIVPPLDRVALYNLEGEKLCHRYAAKQVRPQSQVITLLLDRSASMAGEIQTVITTAKNLLNQYLPKTAQCAVASFDHNWEFHHSHYKACNSGDFGFEKIELGGGTDFHSPLKGAFENHAETYFNDYQKTIILITDGNDDFTESELQELRMLKGDNLLLGYFIGGDKRDSLELIVDHFIAQDGNIETQLNQYFANLGNGYKHQQVFHVSSCSAGSQP